MDMADISGRKKTHGRRHAARHGELIDHSAFRGRAQEARAAGQRDAGPVDGPGQPAAPASDGRNFDWSGIAEIAGRMRNGSTCGSMHAIFPDNIATNSRCLRSARRMHRPEYPSSRQK
ncbi:hypothetical protein [Burkholderia cepacia]|uniref:hypothetical protein n=1 Tax=Burkholderia cepacia TaxID=292 RepID=UPI0011D1DCDC|nr:hypothetical protein [Burkholderia cepacia]